MNPVCQPDGRILDNGFFDVAGEFARQVRAFDQEISDDDIYQAARNVMTMNFMQLLLDIPVSLTPSIFAYSMLYPYTDNLLDDPDLSTDAKESASSRLGLRLSAEILEPCNPVEAAVFRLIEKIESEYPRIDFPEIYASLLAIHAGQAKSLRQQGGNVGRDQIKALESRA